MKELHAVGRAAVAVDKARRDARRATEDEVPEKSLAKYRKAFSSALDGLEKSLEALSKVSKAGSAPQASATFDWAGIAKAGIAVAKAVNRAKREGRPVSSVVGEIIDAEIVE